MKLSFDFEKIIEFKNPFEPSIFMKLKRSLLTLMLRQKDKLFQNSVDPDGQAWAPLHSLTAARKNKKSKKSDAEIGELQKLNKNFKQHKILIDTSALKNSITNPTAPYAIRLASNNEVKFGTNLPYAKIQNGGGDIKRNGQTIGKIKARPFIGFGDNDNKQVNEKISQFIAKEMKK